MELAFRWCCCCCCSKQPSSISITARPQPELQSYSFCFVLFTWPKHSLVQYGCRSFMRRCFGLVSNSDFCTWGYCLLCIAECRHQTNYHLLSWYASLSCFGITSSFQDYCFTILFSCASLHLSFPCSPVLLLKSVFCPCLPVKFPVHLITSCVEPLSDCTACVSFPRVHYLTSVFPTVSCRFSVQHFFCVCMVPAPESLHLSPVFQQFLADVLFTYTQCSLLRKWKLSSPSQNWLTMNDVNITGKAMLRSLFQSIRKLFWNRENKVKTLFLRFKRP